MSDDKKTFETHDLLESKKFAESLKQYCLVSKDFPDIEGSFNISLNADFGCGKSFFLDMFQNMLKEQKHDVVKIDIWRNDFYDEPIITILAEIIFFFTKKYPDTATDELKDLFNRMGRFAIKLTPIAPIKQKLDDANQEVDGGIFYKNKIYEDYTHRKDLFDELKEKLQKLTQDKEKPLFIFIDELDRCRPTHAINFLEVLKHFFDVPNIIFIIAANRTQLESSARALFGQDLNFDEYYRKFIHKEINLPKPSGRLFETYFEKKYQEFKKNFDNEHIQKLDIFLGTNDDYTFTLLNKNLLTLRQLNEIIRFIIYIMRGKPNIEYRWFHLMITYIIISFIDRDIADKLHKNTISFKELLQRLDEYQMLYSIVIYQLSIGYSSNYQEFQENSELVRELYPQYYDERFSDAPTDLELRFDYKRGVKPLRDIMDKVEQAKSLLSTE